MVSHFPKPYHPHQELLPLNYCNRLNPAVVFYPVAYIGIFSIKCVHLSIPLKLSFFLKKASRYSAIGCADDRRRIIRVIFLERVRSFELYSKKFL